MSRSRTVSCLGAVFAVLGASLGAAWAGAAEPASFDEALETILGRSTAIAAQVTVKDTAAARSLQARAVFAPALSLNASRGLASPSLQATVSDTRSLTMDASMNLFRFGGDWLGARAASRTDAAEENRSLSAVLSVEELGVEALVTEIEARMRLDLQRERLRTLGESLDIAKQRYSSGLLAQEEVDRISIDLDNAQVGLRDLELAELAARQALEPLLGDGEVRPVWPWMARLPRDIKPESPLAKLELAGLPDWSAARADLDSEEARVSQRYRGFLPSLDARGSYGYLQSAGLGGTGWNGQLTLSLPLFDQLQTWGDYQAEKATRTRAELQLEEVEREARAAFANGLSGYQVAIQSALEREHTVNRASELYESDLRAFRQGLRSANELALDEGRLFDSRSAAIHGWSEAHSAFTRLSHALGRRVKDVLPPGAP